jgi:deoxyribodipyrimidine photo-lyase
VPLPAASTHGAGDDVAVVLFTRDLRVADHPALVRGAAHAELVALFVVDPAIARSAQSVNRSAFLSESLSELGAELAVRGIELVVGHGDTASVAIGLCRDRGAATLYLTGEISAAGRRRAARLRQLGGASGVEVLEVDSHYVVSPGALRSSGGGAFRVFTPFYRRWQEVPRRPVLAAPEGRRAIRDVEPLAIDPAELSGGSSGEASARRAIGGERAARAVANRFVREGLEHYGERRDLLAIEGTSSLSGYLRFGCISALELASRLEGRPGSDPYLRQLAWRDFFAHLLAEDPTLAARDLRPVVGGWIEDPAAARAWRAGETGYPLVDAAMRQLEQEGTMHNRARMVVASFLTKDLLIDWRVGAAHFARLLVDGDVASNALSWQWVAGTGTDTNPFRVLNPTTQSRRFDPDGSYLRRYLPELASLDAREIHDPSPEHRAALRYPSPIIEHAATLARYRSVRSGRGAPD